VIKTLHHGHCLIVLPLVLYQGINVMFLVERGLVIKVGMKEDSSFTTHNMAKSLRIVMLLEEENQLKAWTNKSLTYSMTKSCTEIKLIGLSDIWRVEYYYIWIVVNQVVTHSIDFIHVNIFIFLIKAYLSLLLIKYLIIKSNIWLMNLE